MERGLRCLMAETTENLCLVLSSNAVYSLQSLRPSRGRNRIVRPPQIMMATDQLPTRIMTLKETIPHIQGPQSLPMPLKNWNEE